MLNLRVKTVTPVGIPRIQDEQPVAYCKNFIYFINRRKLDSILSYMQLLLEFNDYINATNNKNITLWLKSKGILNEKFLQEIYVYKLRSCFINNIDILQFSNQYPQKELNKILTDTLKENLKNIVLFDHLQNNNQKFNDFVKPIFEFFKNKHIYCQEKQTNDFFISCLLNIDKIRLEAVFKEIDSLKITCQNDLSLEEDFSLYRIFHPEYAIYRECLKSQTILHYTIEGSRNNIFFKTLDKYLEIASFLNKQRILAEGKSHKALFAGKNLSSLKTLEENTHVINSNFSLINQNMAVLLNLNTTNLLMLNKCLQNNGSGTAEQEYVDFISNDNKTLKPINYTFAQLF